MIQLCEKSNSFFFSISASLCVSVSTWKVGDIVMKFDSRRIHKWFINSIFVVNTSFQSKFNFHIILRHKKDLCVCKQLFKNQELPFIICSCCASLHKAHLFEHISRLATYGISWCWTIRFKIILIHSNEICFGFWWRTWNKCSAFCC
jgi:hypothetical protein